jgi:predicted RNA-binding Zn ribbon-like protein
MIGFDDFVGGAPALDFVNTVGGIRTGAHTEKLQSYDDLVQWAVLAGMFGRKEADSLLAQGRDGPSAADQALLRAKNFREALHRVLAARLKGKAVPVDALDCVNAEIGRAMAHARLKKTGDGYAWAWRIGPGELDAPLWIAARSAAELLTTRDIDRLRECESETCGWYFLDLSKNRSRRWCAMKGCGNRAKLRRYRSAKSA